MIVQPATAGATGVDTVTVIHATMAHQLKLAGLAFVVRYLGSLTMAERDIILRAGLALLAVGYSRRPGWYPTKALGEADGGLAVQRAMSAGLPEGVSLACDYEGASGTAADCIAYVNAWATAVQDAGYRAELYIGYGVPLTPDQLYHTLKITGYWHSCSTVPDVAHRGYNMRQLTPGNVHAFGTLVDYDVVQTDKLGGVPYWLAP